MAVVRINYEKYSFSPPSRISLTQYSQFKQACRTNPNFSFGAEEETFFGHWSWLWKTIGIIIAVTIVASIIEEIFGLLSLFLGGLTSILLLIQFLLEAPSFALYLKEKRSYFEKMKRAIIVSQNYEHFCEIFPQYESRY
jgi:hypothetical protein